MTVTTRRFNMRLSEDELRQAIVQSILATAEKLRTPVTVGGSGAAPAGPHAASGSGHDAPAAAEQ
jgi:hypothetical protein